MNTTINETELSTTELKLKRKKNLINKWFLGIFLAITVIVFILKVIDGALLDFGYGIDEALQNAGVDIKHPKTFHAGFWSNTEVIRIVNDVNSYDSSHKALPAFAPIISMYRHHPSSFWLLTQFTWITTIVIMLFLVFRFFKYEDSLPRWLKWIMTQRTLSLVTIYDMIVGIVFWVGMFKDFGNSFNPELKYLEMLITIVVHAFIPLFMIIYAEVYTLKDKKASILKEVFILKGMIYPLGYFLYYLMLTGVWTDPYNITQMHDSLITVPAWGLNGENTTLSGHTWISELWKLGFVVIGMWILMGIMILIHNLTLLKFNKSYDSKHDYEVLARQEKKIEKIKASVIRKCAKNQNMEFDLIEEKLKKRNEDQLKNFIDDRKKKR